MSAFPSTFSDNTASSSRPVKRARSSSESMEPEGLNEHSFPDDGDNSAQAKAARKEARIIRNRESAQRSRNQRKAHLAYLESRVAELEAENKSLRSGSPTRSTSAAPPSVTASRSSSPSITVSGSDMSIATNGGVNLAAVAPPPAGVDIAEDVKPLLSTDVLNTVVDLDRVTSLLAENAALRDRVALLENLVKQVVAVSNLSSVTPVSSSVAGVDSLLAPSSASTGLRSTLSPAFRPDAVDFSVSPLVIPDQLPQANDLNLDLSIPATSLEFGNNSEIDNTSIPVARHPAAVATNPCNQGKALQRARGTLPSSQEVSAVWTLSSGMKLDLGSDKGKARLAMVGRLVVALAKRRGWSSFPTLGKPKPMGMGCSPCHPARLNRVGRRRRNGTRG